MKHAIAERFFAPQGEGLYTGTPMAFIRFVGCSVGQNVCNLCDTDFSKMHFNLGGGLLYDDQLVKWANPYKHVCLTGGEPLDRELNTLIRAFAKEKVMVHIETSGTVDKQVGMHPNVWLTVSPKPGYHPEMILKANEVKLILGGLGLTTEGWPTFQDAVEWANAGKLVYVQPRNLTKDIDMNELRTAIDIVTQYPQLRLSVQLHKFLRTR